MRCTVFGTGYLGATHAAEAQTMLGERYDVNRTMRAGEMVFIDYGA